MVRVIKSHKIPIKLWLEDIDPQALKQAENLADFPFAVGHVAIMPDSHVGYGMPIGAILATDNVAIPNAVGVDIGCGVCAVQTSLENITAKNIKKALSIIRLNIPLGFKHHKHAQDESLMPKLHDELMPTIKKEHRKALHQLGTLGGGNHFIEIQKGNDGRIWIMIHSGSRNLGHQVASRHNNIAKQMNETLKVKVPKEWQLAYLPSQTKEFDEYMAEMTFCVDFALANRKLMMKRVKEALLETAGPMEFGELINKSHNFAAKEMHGGREVLVHRKGATRVRKNERGLIPGSQGSKSYIVRGLGNAESYYSCSHGAGRKLGRKQAIKKLSFEQEKAKLDGLGVIHALRNKNDLDEAPGAYKDITQVMKSQEDLVDSVVELTPLAVVKG